MGSVGLSTVGAGFIPWERLAYRNTCPVGQVVPRPADVCEYVVKE
jgi:hypothetical protein